ncbi:MAG TPA: hypothetical protein VNC40_15455 [Gaiellaceae bacterium]|nr:hypothetical protein [Gaiellaceae bacterium]
MRPLFLLEPPSSYWGLADVDEIGEQIEILRVQGQERNLMSVCRCGDDKIDRSAARFAAPADQGCREPAPFARDRRIDRERIEGRLDDSEPLRPARSFVVRTGDQHPEMQLGERRGADRSLQLPGTFGPDQDGGVEKDTHLRKRIDEATRQTSQVVFERLRRGRLPDPLQAWTGDPLAGARRPEPSDRAAGDGDSELFACLRPPQYLANVIPEFLLWDRRHDPIE